MLDKKVSFRSSLLLFFGALFLFLSFFQLNSLLMMTNFNAVYDFENHYLYLNGGGFQIFGIVLFAIGFGLVVYGTVEIIKHVKK